MGLKGFEVKVLGWGLGFNDLGVRGLTCYGFREKFNLYMILNIQESEYMCGDFLGHLFFVAFKKGYHHWIVGTLVRIDGGDD